jgi:hypothetical protein
MPGPSRLKPTGKRAAFATASTATNRHAFRLIWHCQDQSVGLLPGVVTAMLTTVAARRFASRDAKSTQHRASAYAISLGVLEQSP